MKEDTMPLVTLGRNNIAALIVSTGAMRPWGATGAYFIVGNSTATHATANTWMAGAASTMNAMDAGYPTRATNVCTFRATFSTAQANFAWNEWGITNTTSTADAAQSLLNRKVEDPSLGTKTSAQSWQITADITFTT
jgi:hypothetical protein